ncbi:nucleoside-diphosphate-sugar epimerase [Paenibacillus pabuli]|uniref:Nucleoside-diphosphate-sugar epimerase n=1 Tax=Paenibacillus pabuli TaxID=1472 RepID=A0ABX9BJI4_9BACL|nr:alpha/beta fold hydrolase [Paenibacillus pabuli]RAI94718.1 nucleoside-diphosphate-sugar epimerase [Paenibacillus pabuli]
MSIHNSSSLNAERETDPNSAKNNMATESTTILITGSTGFIGKEAVKQLGNSEAQLLLLVRSESKARMVLNAYGVTDFSRITCIQGDLSALGLGLTKADRERALQANVIIHAGGTMDVTLQPKVAEQIFMNGARGMAELAEEIQRKQRLRHFIHVVGFMSPYGRKDSPPISSTNEDVGDKSSGQKSLISKAFHSESAYEHMKFEADRYIRQHAEQHSYVLSVVNPSTIVGPYPTGATEQTGGIGMMIQAMRRRRMPVIPGGRQHWLPLVSNDVVAKTLVFLTQDSNPSGGTYPLLSRKADGPDMKELIRLMAVELDVSAPRWSVPLPLIHAAMKAGGTKISGIPPESISFITKQEFEVQQTERLFRRMGLNLPEVSELLPYVTADLDYRFSYPAQEDLPQSWTRARKGSLAVLLHEGQGEPWVIVHGLMSSADDMIPLGDALWSMTGNPVWLVDLAGFGRSPVHRNKIRGMAFKGQVEAVRSVLDEIQGPVKLVGHSVGAAIAAAVMQESGHENIQLAMLQPVWGAPKDGMQRLISRFPRRMLQGLLSRMTPQQVAGQFTRADASEIDPPLLEGYARRASSGLKSPRIAGANADLLHWIQSHSNNKVSQTSADAQRTLMVWGTNDKGYARPENIHSSVQQVELPYGHQFPLFQAEETASLLVEWQMKRG